MPRRFLLSAEQRTRLFAIPVDHAEMAKHYVLSAGTQRSAHGRSGTAPFPLCVAAGLFGVPGTRLEGICVVVGHLSARGPWGEFQVPPPRQTTCSLGYPSKTTNETPKSVSFGLIIEM
jgi:hypothetical protein